MTGLPLMFGLWILVVIVNRLPELLRSFLEPMFLLEFSSWFLSWAFVICYMFTVDPNLGICYRLIRRSFTGVITCNVRENTKKSGEKRKQKSMEREYFLRNSVMHA